MIFGGGSSGAIGTGIVYSLYDNFSATATKIGSGWNKLAGTTDKATARIQGSMNKIRMGFKTMILGAVLLAPVIMGVGKSMAFNATMSEVFAKAQVKNIDIQKQLAIEAMRLGEATKFSAKQAAEGQVFLAQAGFKVVDIMSAMPGVLDLAAAGNIDLAKSADIASNILTAMGLKATEMTRVADVLALGASSANVSVDMLGDSFAYAASTARGMNWSLEQTTAMVGLLGNIGIQGSAAGTAIANFNRFLTKLDNDKLKKIGLTMNDIKDSAGNMRNVEVVLATIMDSMKDLGNFDQQKILGELFGPRGGKTIAAFRASLEQGMNFTGFVENLKNASGAAADISSQMMNNLKGDLTILKSVWETTLIKIGNNTESAWRPLVQVLTKLVSFFGKLVQHPIGKWVIRLTALVGGLAVAFGLVIIVTNLASLAAGKAALSFASMGKAELAATFATKGLTAGLWAVTKAAFKALIALWPFLLIGAAIAGVIWLVNKSLKSFDEVLKGTAEPAKGFLGFLQKLGGIMRAVVEIWKSANSEGFTMSESLAAALEKLGIMDTAIAIGTWIVRIKAFFKGIGDGVRAAVSFIKPVFKLIGDGLEWLGGMFDKFGWTTRKSGSELGPWAEAGKVLGIVIVSLLVPAFISLAISVLAATWPILLIIGAIVGIIWLFKNWGKVVDWFSKIWSQFWNWVKEKFSAFLAWGKGLNEKFKAWGKGLLTGIKDGIKNAWTSFKNWFKGLIDDLLAPIKGVFNFLGIGKDSEEGDININKGDKNIDVNRVSELAIVNAENRVNQFTVPEPKVLQNNQTTEVVKSININIDGKEVKNTIDEINEEESDRQ